MKENLNYIDRHISIYIHIYYYYHLQNKQRNKRRKGQSTFVDDTHPSHTLYTRYIRQNRSMIGSTTSSVKRFSIITTTTSKRNTLPLVQVLLVLLLHCIMGISTCMRVVAFTVRHHGTSASSTTTRRMMIPTSFHGFSSTTTTSSSLFSSNNNNNNSEEYSTTAPVAPTTGPRTTTNGKFATIPRRANTSTNHKFFPKPQINGRTYSSSTTNGRIDNASNSRMPPSSSSFSTTSSFEDDDLDTALDNVLSPTSTNTATRNSPDVSYNPVRCFFVGYM